MASVPPNPAQDLRTSLRADLVAAMKARDADAVSALRGLTAAIDNAEAVAPGTGDGPTASAHVAGATPGVGSTEAVRRALTADELRRILDDEIADRRREAAGYDALDRAAAAEGPRRQADVLAGWVGRLPRN